MPPKAKAGSVCQWINRDDALRHFATYGGQTQSQQHIKPLHWYVACRLVIEGGFPPEQISPRPPFFAKKRGTEFQLVFDPAAATGDEAIVLGGLKTKNVDVVITKPRLGPVLAVSCKGMTGAFRNLTNRMEDCVGECTNLHITYPALVLGYLFVIRANKVIERAVGEAADERAAPAKQLAANDIAIRKGGEPIEAISRFHTALRELTGRRGIRDDVSRYEAVALAMVDMSRHQIGALLPSFPPPDSPLRMEQFFSALYLRYDERYVFSAPDLKPITRRVGWSADSPALSLRSRSPSLDYSPRATDSTDN
jgi:hypothetical protein